MSDIAQAEIKALLSLVRQLRQQSITYRKWAMEGGLATDSYLRFANEDRKAAHFYLSMAKRRRDK